MRNLTSEQAGPLSLSMKPTKRYVVTAALYSFINVAVFSVPALCAATLQTTRPSSTSLEIWIVTVLFGTLLTTIYSSMAKPLILRRLNWLIVPVVGMLIFGITWLLNPTAAIDGIGLVLIGILFFSFLSFGLPIFVTLLLFLLHTWECDKIPSEKT